jgi:hypothetical protein
MAMTAIGKAKSISFGLGRISHKAMALQNQ